MADNTNHELLHAESADGIHWTRRKNVGEQGRYQPSLVSFNGVLFLAFVANNPTNDLLYTQWDEAKDQWLNHKKVEQSALYGPALAVFNQKLRIYFVANNGTDSVLVSEFSRSRRITRSKLLVASRRVGARRFP